MDDLIDIVDLLGDSGFEELIVWVLRAIGIVAILLGIGLWLFTEMTLLGLPAVLIIVGFLLVLLPGILLELAG